MKFPSKTEAAKPLLPALILYLIFTSVLSAQSTVSLTDRYSWLPNAGWADWRSGTGNDGAVFNSDFVEGNLWLSNIGWVDLGDGPLNGTFYGNSSATDFGVNVISETMQHYYLGGYSWSANAGWLSFDLSLLSDADRPRIDKNSGLLTGYVWSPNMGWVLLSSPGDDVNTGLTQASSIQDWMILE